MVVNSVPSPWLSNGLSVHALYLKKNPPHVAICSAHFPQHLHPAPSPAAPPPASAGPSSRPPPRQSSLAATCTCGRPEPAGDQSPLLAYPHLPLCPPATATANSMAKARRRPVPAAPSTRLQNGPRRRYPLPTHPPLYATSYERRVKNICCKSIFQVFQMFQRYVASI
jgi:hypothetical protein